MEMDGEIQDGMEIIVPALNPKTGCKTVMILMMVILVYPMQMLIMIISVISMLDQYGMLKHQVQI
jgi:hypothetical protein